MKLATVNPEVNIDIDRLVFKDPVWDHDLHNLLQMGFDANSGINNLGQNGRAKMDLLKQRSKKCNTTRGKPKAWAKEEANQSEWRQGGEKRKIEQCKGERSCPLFSGNPPPHMSKKRERGRKNNHFTLAHEVAGLARESGTRHLLNKTKNKAIQCPREKLVMIAMNAALEDVYKKVFADSYQHGAPQRGVKRLWRL
ncbi:hypothetical protein Tco_1409566 [Tanacetum coccineum]